VSSRRFLKARVLPGRSSLRWDLEAVAWFTRLIRLFREHHLAAEDVIHRDRVGQDDGYADDRHDTHETQRLFRRGAVVNVQVKRMVRRREDQGRIDGGAEEK